MRPEIAPGARVRLTTPLAWFRVNADLALDCDTGTIERKDVWADYWIVRLDKPAIDLDCTALTYVPEIREDADNLELIE
mgnify:CR=1 FL=1